MDVHIDVTPYHITVCLTKQALWKLPRILCISRGANTKNSVKRILRIDPSKMLPTFIVKHIQAVSQPLYTVDVHMDDSLSHYC